MSERVEIGKALEEELRQRLGVNQHTKGPENFPDPPKGDTRDLAAKAAGFGNGKVAQTLRQSVLRGTQTSFQISMRPQQCTPMALRGPQKQC